MPDQAETPVAVRPQAALQAEADDSLAAGVVAWPAFRTDSPYNKLLYREMTERGVPVEDFSVRRLLGRAPAILHLHWPEAAVQVPSASAALVRGLALLLLVWITRLRGSRLVWTVHNLHPHERPHPRLERWFWNRFLSLLDGFIALSPGGAEAARAEFAVLRRRSGFIIPIGHYRGSYPDSVGREEARTRLDLPAMARVYGFLGRIRPYKNVPHLVRTFRSIVDQEAHLLVVGQPDTEESRLAVVEAVGDDPRVHLTLEHVSDDMVQVYLRACDLVVLPFTEILNSSSAILALSFDRPALVPLSGAMGELQTTAGTDWVRTFSGALSSSELEASMRWAHTVDRGRCCSLDHLGWSEIARLTHDAYRQLAASRPA